MDRRWKIKSDLSKMSELKDIQKKLSASGENYSLSILKLLENRGITEEKEIAVFFSCDYEKDISDPFLFEDMEKAVQRISAAKEKGEKIAVFGDYDADGVTATALIMEALKDLGFGQIIPYIPDRQIEGYGMNAEALNFLKKDGVSLIITVDCGITNIEEVAQANKDGIDVIITDHHHVPKELPAALAIINPHQAESRYPFRELSGVGTAFKLAQALYAKIKPQDSEQLKWLLDLVAIGTIADCVTLLGENRVLVKYGLIVLSKTKRTGLLEMFKVGRIDISEGNIPDTHKVAFQISPRINAAGRMDHASTSFKLMTEGDRVKARSLALEVEEANQNRQKITGEIVRETRTLAENSFKNKKLIFAYNENWRVGILGLIAGKIVDEFQKPTAIFQKQDSEFVGSLRSIDQLNIIEALEKCSDILIKFGGHSQAAGVRVAHEKMEEFYERLSDIVEKELKGKETIPEIEIDMEIGLEEVSWELMADLKKMEPFGEGNSEPVFLAKDVIIEEARMVGNGSKHLKLSLRSKSGGPKVFDAIGFRLGESFSGLKSGDLADMVFNLQEDEWNGNKKLQINIIDLKLKAQ